MELISAVSVELGLLECVGEKDPLLLGSGVCDELAVGVADNAGISLRVDVDDGVPSPVEEEVDTVVLVTLALGVENGVDVPLPVDVAEDVRD